MQMVNHGITTGGLFLCVGIIYERTHSRQILDNTGLAGPMPRYALFLMIFALSSLGLPGTNSFVGEFLVLAGTFLWSRVATAFAALGVILAAAYILWLMQRVVFGSPSSAHRAQLLDLNARETATLVPLVILVFVIGIFPNPLLTRMHASVAQLLAAPKTPAFAIDARPKPLASPATPAAVVATGADSSSEQVFAQ